MRFLTQADAAIADPADAETDCRNRVSVRTSGPERIEAEAGRPGAVVRCLEQGLSLLSRGVEPPAIDLGCSVGRSTFVLAGRCDGPVLGVDVNFSMLRLAARVLRSGVVRYPRRRVGIVYDRRELRLFEGAGGLTGGYMPQRYYAARDERLGPPLDFSV